MPVGLALDLLSPEPVWAKSQTAWQARRDTGDSAPLGLALGCSWASRPGPARAQQTAADTAAERADCAVPLAPSWAVARALTVLGAPRVARCPHAQCAHSVHPTPSRLNSDGTGRTKVTVAADGTCALICAASGEVQPSDAKKKVRRTVPQHQHAHAGLPPGKLGRTRRRRRRRRSTWAATPSSRARGTGSGRSGKTSGAVDPGCCPRVVACRVGWSSR